jgi:hypothetical protein
MFPQQRTLPENLARSALARHAKASGELLPVQVEACLSCGSTRGLDGTTIQVHCVEGRTETARVCRSCAKARGIQ